MLAGCGDGPGGWCPDLAPPAYGDGLAAGRRLRPAVTAPLVFGLAGASASRPTLRLDHGRGSAPRCGLLRGAHPTRQRRHRAPWTTSVPGPLRDLPRLRDALWSGSRRARRGRHITICTAGRAAQHPADPGAVRSRCRGVLFAAVILCRWFWPSTLVDGRCGQRGGVAYSTARRLVGPCRRLALPPAVSVRTRAQRAPGAA